MNTHEPPLTLAHPQLLAALSGLPMAALLVDRSGTIIFANAPLLALFGYAADALNYQSVELLLPEAMRETHAMQREAKASHFRTHAMGSGLLIVGRHSDGSEIPLEVRLQTNASEFGLVTVAFVSDLRQQFANHREVERLNRTLRLVHECSAITVRARNEDNLLSGIRQCLSKIGLYQRTWIGLLPFDGGCFKVAVGTLHGRDDDVRDGMTEVELVARRAIAVRTPILLSPCELQKEVPGWCAVEPGGTAPSLMALPLMALDTIYGCLCVMSNSETPFLANEVELLQELADDLAFGLEALASREARRSVESRLRLLERAVEASPSAVIITDALNDAHPILYVNPAFERMTGYSASEALGGSGRLLLRDDLEQDALEDIRSALRGRYEAKGLLRNYRKDGALFWNELTVAPVRDENGVMTHVVSVMNDVTARKVQEEQIEQHMLFDALTGLPNRASLFVQIGRAADSAQKGRYALGVVLIALDRFSLVNDAYGHDAGDDLLIAVGSRLVGMVRARDTVARLGGDEFVVLLPKLGADEALSVVEKIRAGLGMPFSLDCGEVVIGASIGVSFAPRDGDDAQTLIRNAEVAMQGAKTGGWNAVRFYAEDMNRRTGERLAMEFDLRRALDRGEFEIFYQPIIDIETGRIVEAEALLRWNRPQHGMVAPDSFIPLAETSGLIVPIGKWVLEQACRQNVLWQGAGLPPIRVGVNLSARQFREPEFETMVAEVLAASGLAGCNLVLEVTESLLMTHIENVSETLRHLKQLGVHISLDDFGTGYSSLSYLKRLPLDTLKIDRSFVRDIGSDPNDAVIATTIVSMARTMHLKVIAEGVETGEQLGHLRANGCEQVQGYLFSPPVPAAQFEKLLIDRASPDVLS